MLLIISVLACKKKSDDAKILAINDMKTIIWDMTLADEWFNQISNTDSLHKNRKMNIQLYEQVFTSHNITKKNFYTSYQYYQLHPDKMKILIDSVCAYGDRINNSYKGLRKY
jgi:hypothetical protein